MSRPGAARLLARVIVFAALSVAISLVFAWAADRLPAVAWVVGLAGMTLLAGGMAALATRRLRTPAEVER